MSAQAFWAVVFWLAFLAFAVISGLIAVKGLGEIRALFDHLRQRRGDGGPPEQRG